MLNILPELPEGLLDLPASQLHTLLPGPSLIHLPGRREPPLFVAVLLHGNEDTGWEALRTLLKRYRERQLPRALSCFIGNVQAASQGVRHLPGQADFNRIWGGGTGAEQRMAARVLEEIRQRQVFASIDIHNNTGLNPHYACVNRTEAAWLHLATLFSRTVVYFTRPSSVLSLAMASFSPSVTLECGQAGDPHGTQHALDYLEACLHLSHLPERELPPGDISTCSTPRRWSRYPTTSALALPMAPMTCSSMPDWNVTTSAPCRQAHASAPAMTTAVCRWISST